MCSVEEYITSVAMTKMGRSTAMKGVAAMQLRSNERMGLQEAAFEVNPCMLKKGLP
jgi:hypothetical protein